MKVVHIDKEPCYVGGEILRKPTFHLIVEMTQEEYQLCCQAILNRKDKLSKKEL